MGNSRKIEIQVLNVGHISQSSSELQKCSCRRTLSNPEQPKQLQSTSSLSNADTRAVCCSTLFIRNVRQTRSSNDSRERGLWGGTGAALAELSVGSPVKPQQGENANNCFFFRGLGTASCRPLWQLRTRRGRGKHRPLFASTSFSAAYLRSSNIRKRFHLNRSLIAKISCTR